MVELSPHRLLAEEDDRIPEEILEVLLLLEKEEEEEVVVREAARVLVQEATLVEALLEAKEFGNYIRLKFSKPIEFFYSNWKY